MRGVRGEMTQDYVIFEPKLQDFEGLVRPEIVESHDHVLLSRLPYRQVRH